MNGLIVKKQQWYPGHGPQQNRSPNFDRHFVQISTFRPFGIVGRDSEIVGLTLFKAWNGAVGPVAHIQRTIVVPAGSTVVNLIAAQVGVRAGVPGQCDLSWIRNPARASKNYDEGRDEKDITGADPIKTIPW